MTKDGGRRIATSKGAMLADPNCLGNLLEAAGEALFDPEYWQRRGEILAVNRGRGAAWFVSTGTHQWVLRHFRRGGCIAMFSRDRYIWTGESRVRCFAEWRMLSTLSGLGLPVPKPVAARYRRTGLRYCCDLITQRIPDADPLSAVLAVNSVPEPVWRGIGAAIARLHRAGADHADLNAHNVLIDDKGASSVIDFDRGRLREYRGGGRAWMQSNLRRLRRSLQKIARDLPRDRFSDEAWDWLLAGYRSQETGS